MNFFESLILLLLAAVLLLQAARRFSLPYPSLLALAGVGVALIPGAPKIAIDPQTALALFIAPALLDAAFDFPPHAARRLWRPLVVLAGFAVLLTTGVVAWLGWSYAGLPIAAAIALGAIVAPSDAAAASAVLSGLAIPRSSAGVLTGESLFNDATALLLFGGALAVQANGGMDVAVGLQIGLAVPGGLALGVGAALLFERLERWVGGTLGGNLLQFLNAFLVWIVADRLDLSAVLAEVAFAMTIARSAATRSDVRMRVHSLAVWASVVFVLNVVAFLLMGMQARTIVEAMGWARFERSLPFVGMVIAAVVVVRMVVVLTFNRLAARFEALRSDGKRATLRQGLLVGWSGMRGLVTLATAFALPQGFPQRDLLVLTAFAVVLATLIIQGLTLAPMIHLLRLDRTDAAAGRLDDARGALIRTGLATLDGESGREADLLRTDFRLFEQALAESGDDGPLERYREVGLRAVSAQRACLEQLRRDHRVEADAYYLLQEELDWRELSLLPAEQRQIEEN